jgi:hypothetical protein
MAAVGAAEQVLLQGVCFRLGKLGQQKALQVRGVGAAGAVMDGVDG